MPVLIHQADPAGFFEPVTPDNEHYESLIKYPSWSFADPKFPRKVELLKRRDNLVRQHPDTIFILPHFGNYAENIKYTSNLLDENPNVYIDFSARIDELGRQPYTTREFFIKHQDRIIFGTDMPANIESSVEMYQTYFRFLETYDESFYSPDYDGTFDRSRWPICGIGLPKEVLKKIYHENILRIIPSLKNEINLSLK
jgi:predicted TIM-barrel fold metal-dependent hydrolase